MSTDVCGYNQSNQPSLIGRKADSFPAWSPFWNDYALNGVIDG